jgi:hypothetical protein
MRMVGAKPVVGSGLALGLESSRKSRQRDGGRGGRCVRRSVDDPRLILRWPGWAGASCASSPEVR